MTYDSQPLSQPRIHTPVLLAESQSLLLEKTYSLASNIPPEREREKERERVRQREREREMLAVLANPEITQMLEVELWHGRVC